MSRPLHRLFALGSAALLVITTATLSACAPVVERTVNKSWVGTDKARAASWFMMPGGVPEAAPPGVRPEVVRDEATLMSVDEGETCFAMTLRTEVDRDAPLDSHQIECVVGSNRAYAAVSNELVAMRDHAAGGAQKTVVGPTDAATFATIDIDPPAAGEARIVERSAEVCCPIRTFDWVELQIMTPVYQPGEPAAYNGFGWRILDR